LCNIEEITAASKDRKKYLRQAGLLDHDIAYHGFLEYSEHGIGQYVFNKGFHLCGCHFAASQV